MAIYLDLVMGLNFIVDFLLLLGANRLSGFPPGWGRCALAAALGAVYSGGCLMPGFSFLGNMLWRLVSLGLMGMTAFGMHRSAGKRTGIFLLLSMAMGGVATGFGRNNFGILVVSAVAVWLLCRICAGGGITGQTYVPVTIRDGDKTVGVVALRDTGNSLRDPITGEQVLLIGPKEAEILTGLTPEQLNMPMQTMLAHPLPGLRLIPYAAVGKESGMLLGKRMDMVQIGSWRGRAVVAFAPERIGKGAEYGALTGGAIC